VSILDRIASWFCRNIAKLLGGDRPVRIIEQPADDIEPLLPEKWGEVDTSTQGEVTLSPREVRKQWYFQVERWLRAGTSATVVADMLTDLGVPTSPRTVRRIADELGIDRPKRVGKKADIEFIMDLLGEGFSTSQICRCCAEHGDPITPNGLRRRIRKWQAEDGGE